MSEKELSRIDKLRQARRKRLLIIAETVERRFIYESEAGSYMSENDKLRQARLKRLLTIAETVERRFIYE